MLETLHAAGIRVFVDVVPNHSSDQHEWFQAALKAPKGSRERDRYIFRDGKGENGEIRPSELISQDVFRRMYGHILVMVAADLLIQ